MNNVNLNLAAIHFNWNPWVESSEMKSSNFSSG